ncbi:MAG: hypothetical protein ACYCV7_12175 [Acidimicrobiales bacterium]
MDNAERAQFLAAMGVDALITNRPSAILAAVGGG